jgi:hypothetical protein
MEYSGGGIAALMSHWRPDGMEIIPKIEILHILSCHFLYIRNLPTPIRHEERYFALSAK